MSIRPDDLSDPVDLSSHDSFPASDPPGWIGNSSGSGARIQEGKPMHQVVPSLSSLDHVRGDPRATRILIEYGDYQCPYCAAAEPVVVEILRRNPTGLAHTFRHFPLSSIHPMAEPAAETAEFAGDHGAFWAMHSALMARSGNLSLPGIFDLAALLGLPITRLRDALATGACAAKVRHDLALGLHGGVQGTPTFFIDGALYEGPVTIDALDAAIHQTAGRIITLPVAGAT